MPAGDARERPLAIELCADIEPDMLPLPNGVLPAGAEGRPQFGDDDLPGMNDGKASSRARVFLRLQGTMPEIIRHCPGGVSFHDCHYFKDIYHTQWPRTPSAGRRPLKDVPCVSHEPPRPQWQVSVFVC